MSLFELKEVTTP